MIQYSCPDCEQSIEVPVSQGGQQLHCPSCGTLTTVPQTELAPVEPTSPSLNMVTVPILISGIGNILFSYLWLYTCIGVIFTVPMVVLCIFEFILYTQAKNISTDDLSRRATTLGIFEILVGLFNLVSLVCGILVLVHAPKLKEQLPQYPAPQSS